MAPETTNSPPHIAMLSSPGMGHLIPLVELAKRLVLHHNFTATFILFSDFSHAQSNYLNSLPSGLSYISLPSISLDDIPADALVETRIHTLVKRSVPHVHNVLRNLKNTTNLAAYFVDLFCCETFSVAKELSIPHYLFFTTSMMVLSLILNIPALDKSTTCEFRDLLEPVVLPGCVPIPPDHLLHPMKDRSNPGYKVVLDISDRFLKAEGILVNSFAALEPGTYKALKETEGLRPPVIPVGPLIWSDANGSSSDAECLDWLNDQPDNSVVYVSFGSGGTLSSLQVTELAWGLEQSGQRFLWVLRRPSDHGPDAAFLSLENSEDLLSYLPVGFLDRTKARGLVVRNWAPQIRILSHRATGGFLSHCGWNSTLESLVHGVPMIAWPLYAEQHVNAVMFDAVGAALRPRWRGRDALVTREDVEEVVKELMEGDKGKNVRGKVKDLQVAAADALDKNGASSKALAEVAEKWKAALSI